jgi:hypothetical protein
MLGGTLLMNAATETAFANYFVNYIRAYQAAVFSLWNFSSIAA